MGENTTPTVDWIKAFPNGELLKEASKFSTILLAFDTEYQSNYTANTNLCLAYTYAVYDLKTGRYKSGILYPNINTKERFTLGEFIHKVLDELGIPISHFKDYHLILIAHFFTAEWAMFSNRKDLHMKFEYIRKTMVTTTRPLKGSILDENGELIPLHIDVRDTMLLLPDGYKSLAAASTFIEGFEKIEVDDYYKSHMLQLLQDDPELFERYAVRDAEVTLLLFIKLQFLLNQINGTNDKLFTTLASATTNDYKNFSRKALGKAGHKSQFGRLGELYLKYESLANSGYLGGLNSSFYIGELTGYTFIDIDFKNAYPTAMNLLRFALFGIIIPKLKRPKKDKKLLEDI